MHAAASQHGGFGGRWGGGEFCVLLPLLVGCGDFCKMDYVWREGWGRSQTLMAFYLSCEESFVPKKKGSRTRLSAPRGGIPHGRVTSGSGGSEMLDDGARDRELVGWGLRRGGRGRDERLKRFILRRGELAVT